MTGPLALVGGAEWQPGCEFDRDLLDRARSTEVLVVPTGAAYEHPDALVAAATAWFEKLGASVRPAMALDRTGADDPALAQWARNAGFIYLAGGSALHIRSTLMQTMLWEAIRAAWQAGAVVAGTSAGAIALCDPMVDPRGGAFTVGLGLVQKIAAVPHADTWSDDKLHRTLQLAPGDIAVLGIPERSAALLVEGEWRAAGQTPVTAWRDGDQVDLSDL